MRLRPECPQCPAELSDAEGIGTGPWVCPTHATVVPLWRAAQADYDAFAEYLTRADGLATWLPWPLPTGAQVSDFGCVTDRGRPAHAAFVSWVGPADGGLVEMTVVTEEPGTGLGGRCSGLGVTDPGPEVGLGEPLLRLRLGGVRLPVWPVSTPDSEVASDQVLDRAVLAGEAEGRWLWLVLRPASAMLLVQDLPPLHDVADLGPGLLALPFAAVPPAW